MEEEGIVVPLTDVTPGKVVNVPPEVILVDPIVGAEYEDPVPHDNVPAPSVVRYLPELDVCEGSSAVAAVVAVVAPVPPCAILNAVVSPVKDVMFELAPDVTNVAVAGIVVPFTDVTPGNEVIVPDPAFMAIDCVPIKNA